MLQLHETLTKKKTAMQILEVAKIQDGYCYTTDIEVFLRSNSCNNYPDGIYHIINAEPIPANVNIDEYPETDFNTDTGFHTFTADQNFFTTLKEAVAFAERKDEMRPAFQGVHYDHINKNLAATNGHIMYIKKHLLESPYSFIIPFGSVDFITKSIQTAKLKEFKAQVHIMPNSHIIFDFNNFQIKTRLINQKFPDYLSVIQHHNKRQFYFDRKTLLNHLKTIKPFAIDYKKTVNFRTNIFNNDFELYAFNEDKNIKKSIPLESANLPANNSINLQDLRLIMPIIPNSGGSLYNTFALNREYLEKVIKSSNAQTVVLTYPGPKKAILINLN